MNQCASRLSFQLHNKGGTRHSRTLNLTGQFVEEAKLLVKDVIRLGTEEKFECMSILFGNTNSNDDGEKKMKPMVLEVMGNIGSGIRIDNKMSPHIRGVVIRLY